jgi:hypothetical protein
MNTKKIITIGLLFVILGVGGWFLYGQVVKPAIDNRTVPVVVNTTIENEEVDLVFSYPSGDDGYAMIEPPTDPTTGLLKSYIIMENASYQAFTNTETPTEAPPAVSIFVIEMPDLPEEVDAGRLSELQVWAGQNPQFTSYPFMTTEAEVIEIDGLTTLRYQADGLYQQEIYLSSYRGRAYVFVGQYINETDDIRKMFQDLMSSVNFM